VNTKEINQLQLEEIDKYKWIESEKVGNDLGDKAIVEWISKNAKSLRSRIEKKQKDIVSFEVGL